MSPRSGLDKATVIEVAVELIDSVGAEGLTLAALASKLGVRIPSLYNHVDGLNGIKRELALYGNRFLMERMGRVAIGKASDDALKATAFEYRAFALEHPGLYEISALYAPDPNDHELLELADLKIEIFTQILSGYEFKQEQSLHIVRGLRSIAHGFVALERAGGFKMALDKDQSFDLLIEIFINGLHKLKRKEI